MVDELLTENNEWNEPLIHDLFFAPDADSILSIPLRSMGGDDWLAWSKEKSRVYTVWSAYRALMEAQQSEEARITMVLFCPHLIMIVKCGRSYGN
jgi:hypothetical protein